jgi:hypothetical protein
MNAIKLQSITDKLIAGILKGREDIHYISGFTRSSGFSRYVIFQKGDRQFILRVSNHWGKNYWVKKNVDYDYEVIVNKNSPLKQNVIHDILDEMDKY